MVFYSDLNDLFIDEIATSYPRDYQTIVDYYLFNEFNQYLQHAFSKKEKSWLLLLNTRVTNDEPLGSEELFINDLLEVELFTYEPLTEESNIYCQYCKQSLEDQSLSYHQSCYDEIQAFNIIDRGPYIDKYLVCPSCFQEELDSQDYIVCEKCFESIEQSLQGTWKKKRKKLQKIMADFEDVKQLIWKNI